MNKYSNIKNIIGVVSGKGGVGKSLVTSLLASKCAAAGLKVGILDADVTGPSIPKSFGVNKRAMQDDECLLPNVTENGIKIMSINLLLEDENQPVIWRGPVISGVIEQFWSDVRWGELDYLFVDMPPERGLPVCRKKIEIFGKSQIDETAMELGVPVLAKLPINPEINRLVDSGRVYEAECTELDKFVKILGK